MAATSSIALPGLHSPEAGFDAPFELLAACHDRVRRSLVLLQRLVDHLEPHGADAQASSAAHDVWRYFAVAAPEHHADEEHHVLPALRASGDARLIEAAQRIADDHARLDAIWEELGPMLRAIADEPARWQSAWLPALRDAAQAFIDVHASHVPLEDELAFPAARARLGADAQRAMGDEMAARRRR